MSTPPPEPPARSSTAGAPTGVRGRALSRRERDAVAFLVDHGTRSDPDDPDGPVKDTDRACWRAQLATTRAGRPCGCGTCPSVELTDAAGAGPATTGSRVVLEAHADEAIVLLFIDDDRLSYLELAPTGERTFDEFPDPTDLRTA